MADQRNPAEPTSVLQHNTLMPPGEGTPRALPRPDVGVCRLSPPPSIYNLSSGAGRGRRQEPDSYAIQLQSPTLQSIGRPSMKHLSAGLRFQATRMCGNADGHWGRIRLAHMEAEEATDIEDRV